MPPALPGESQDSQGKLVELLRDFAGHGEQREKALRIHFAFNAAPLAIRGEGRARELVLARTRSENGQAIAGGETFSIAADTVISAIGYRSTSFPGLPFDAVRGVVANDRGRVEPGVYTAGWCKRGPQGVVPANRADALAVADLILADLAGREPSAKTGGALIDALLAGRGACRVDLGGWQKINAAEVAAGQGRPREKLVRLEDLLIAAGS